jgi:hypothetical protein
MRVLKSKRSKQSITQDAERRLLSIIYPFIKDIRSWPLILQTISLNPVEFIRYFGYIVAKRSRTLQSARM